MNLFYISCWVKAAGPKRNQRVTGKYYRLAVIAADGHAAERAVVKKYPGCQIRGGVTPASGPKIILIDSWATED